ncbi:MAG: glycosylasparaginase [Ignavibacteriales bacterium]|nr:MAG: glycosylasparaginase [Ignavibacteriales bacterium]
MVSRRKFIISSTVVGAGLVTGFKPDIKDVGFSINQQQNQPVVISTWQHGIEANEVAWEILLDNGRALDAVEQGVRVTEADPNITSVGYGGYPDRDGNVTLDACIMDENCNAGSVAFLKNIMHPISVARLVMEKTPHVMLVGEGALRFALANGFQKENLLTAQSKAAWEKWIKENNYTPYKPDEKNHDTIGMIALDKNGNLSGACTTSGLGFKMQGRIGDSPIIGAGLYVDNEVGAATATGLGEAIIKIVGSHLVVEQMRMGKSPTEACKVAVERLLKKVKGFSDIAGFIALNKQGEYGGYSTNFGFQYAVYSEGENKLINSEFAK